MIGLTTEDARSGTMVLTADHSMPSCIDGIAETIDDFARLVNIASITRWLHYKSYNGVYKFKMDHFDEVKLTPNAEFYLKDNYGINLKDNEDPDVWVEAIKEAKFFTAIDPNLIGIVKEHILYVDRKRSVEGYTEITLGRGISEFLRGIVSQVDSDPEIDDNYTIQMLSKIAQNDDFAEIQIDDNRNWIGFDVNPNKGLKVPSKETRNYLNSLGCRRYSGRDVDPKEQQQTYLLAQLDPTLKITNRNGFAVVKLIDNSEHAGVEGTTNGGNTSPMEIDELLYGNMFSSDALKIGEKALQDATIYVATIKGTQQKRITPIPIHNVSSR